MYFLLSCEHTLLTVAFIGCIHHFTWWRDTLRKTICILLHQAERCLLVWEQSDSPNKFVLGCWGECYTRAIIILRCNNHSGFIAHRAFPSIHCTADKLTQWQSFPYDENQRASASSALWIASSECVSLNHLGLWYYTLREISLVLNKGSINKSYDRVWDNHLESPPLVIRINFSEWVYVSWSLEYLRTYVCLTVGLHMLRPNLIHLWACTCSTISAFYAPSWPSSLQGFLCWSLLRGKNRLITSVKRGRQAGRQEKKKKKKKDERRLGQAQGTQAVQRQADSQRSASHKAAFSCKGGKHNKKWEGFTENKKEKEKKKWEVHLGIC